MEMFIFNQLQRASFVINIQQQVRQRVNTLPSNQKAILQRKTTKVSPIFSQIKIRVRFVKNNK